MNTITAILIGLYAGLGLMVVIASNIYGRGEVKWWQNILLFFLWPLMIIAEILGF